MAPIWGASASTRSRIAAAALAISSSNAIVPAAAPRRQSWSPVWIDRRSPTPARFRRAGARVDEVGVEDDRVRHHEPAVDDAAGLAHGHGVRDRSVHGDDAWDQDQRSSRAPGAPLGRVECHSAAEPDDRGASAGGSWETSRSSASMVSESTRCVVAPAAARSAGSRWASGSTCVTSAHPRGSARSVCRQHSPADPQGRVGGASTQRICDRVGHLYPHISITEGTEPGQFYGSVPTSATAVDSSITAAHNPLVATQSAVDERLLDLLRHRGTRSVAEIAGTLDVGEATVRRSLRRLSGSGRIIRTYGGAVLTGERPIDSVSEARPNAQAKREIGAAAAGLVSDGATVVLSSGSTVLALARRLRGRRLTVVTNAIDVVTALADEPEIEVVVLGGILLPRSRSLDRPSDRPGDPRSAGRRRVHGRVRRGSRARVHDRGGGRDPDRPRDARDRPRVRHPGGRFEARSRGAGVHVRVRPGRHARHRRTHPAGDAVGARGARTHGRRRTIRRSLDRDGGGAEEPSPSGGAAHGNPADAARSCRGGRSCSGAPRPAPAWRWSGASPRCSLRAAAGRARRRTTSWSRPRPTRHRPASRRSRSRSPTASPRGRRTTGRSSTRHRPGPSSTTRWRPTSPRASTSTTSSTCRAGCPSSPSTSSPSSTSSPRS